MASRWHSRVPEAILIEPLPWVTDLMFLCPWFLPHLTLALAWHCTIHAPWYSCTPFHSPLCLLPVASASWDLQSCFLGKGRIWEQLRWVHGKNTWSLGRVRIDRALIFDVSGVMGNRRGGQSRRKSWCWESAFNQVCAYVLTGVLGMKPHGIEKNCLWWCWLQIQKTKREGLRVWLALAVGKILLMALWTTHTLVSITAALCVINVCWHGGLNSQ